MWPSIWANLTYKNNFLEGKGEKKKEKKNFKAWYSLLKVQDLVVIHQIITYFSIIIIIFLQSILLSQTKWLRFWDVKSPTQLYAGSFFPLLKPFNQSLDVFDHFSICGSFWEGQNT